MNIFIILSTQVMPEGRVFGLDAQTVIQIGIQLLNGIILAATLTYILYKPVKEFMQKRTQSIVSDMTEAEETMAQAQELRKEYTARLDEIEQERIEIVESTRQQIAEERLEILKEARSEVSKIKDQALDRVSADRERMEQEMYDNSVDLAYLMAQRYISENMDDEAQERYFNEMLARLEETPWKN